MRHNKGNLDILVWTWKQTIMNRIHHNYLFNGAYPLSSHNRNRYIHSNIWTFGGKEHLINILYQYTPDLSPNDFYMFPIVRQKMCGQGFSFPKEAIADLQTHISRISNSKWRNCFHNWFEHMQQCWIGVYFELTFELLLSI